MRVWMRIVAIVSFAVLVVDFFTLENRVVTTNPVAQGAGRLVGLLAVSAFVCSTLILIVGSRKRLHPGAPHTAPHTSPHTGNEAHQEGVSPKVAAESAPIPTRWRIPKTMIGLLVLASWFIGMPLYAYRNFVAKAPDFAPGPWIADAFLSVFAVAVQVAAPTPIALAFWPSAAMGVYLMFSRKTRPVLDALFGLTSLGIVSLLWYVLAFGVQPGRR